MVRSPAVAGGALQQTGVLPVAAGQPSTTVTTGAPSGPQAPQTIQTAPQGQTPAAITDAAPVKANTTLRLNKQEAVEDQDAALANYVEIARETGNTAGLDATLADAAGKRQDQKEFTKEDLDAIIEEQVGKGKNKDRDRKILRAYILARKAAQGERVKTSEKVGAAFGIQGSRVRQIGNPEKLADIAVSMGFDRNQVFTELGIESTTEGAVDLTQAQESVDGGVDAEAAVDDTAEGDVDANADDSRYWQKSSTAGSDTAVKFVKLADAIDELKATKAELTQLGVVEAAQSVQSRIDELSAKLDTLMAEAAAKDAPKAAPVSKAPATVKEAQQRWKDAGRDITKLSSEDLGLLLPYVRDTIKNTELAGKITAELQSRGDTNAVQVESPASVPVQPKAEAGQGVGGQVRRAPKPAEKSQAPAVILTDSEKAAQAWDVVAADYPQAPKFADLTKAQQNTFIGYGEGNWERGDVELELTKLARAQTKQLANEPTTIDVEARVIEETVAPQVAKLPAPQVTRLENHYGVKRDSAEFMAKVKADVVLYATKGAEAVAGAIRDVIKAIHTGVLSAAMIFNPMQVSQIEAFVMVPQETRTTTQEVLAELPSDVKGMSEAGKQAYATLIPAMQVKGGDKLITIADKPSGNIYVFKPDGSLVIQKKSLFGLAKGDLYKGNQDNPKNRITPAGLFNLKVIDAKAGAAEKRTAGDYDTGTVLAIDDPDAWITIMHSVWLKEKDSSARAAALKTEGAADSRYSFGCINVDKATYKNLMDNYAAQMDGSKLFVVPDNQADTKAFITGEAGGDVLVREGAKPVIKTTTTPEKSVTKTAGADRVFAAREERAPAPTPPRAQEVFMRQSRRSVRTTDQDGVDFESVEASLEDLSGYSDGISAGIRSLRKSGMGNAVDAIDSWMVTFSPVKWDAIYTMMNGKRTIVYNGLILKDKELSTIATLHEVGHGIDEVQGGLGKFSGDKEFKMSKVNGEPMAMRPGTVADELLTYFEDNSDTTALGYLLNYPLDMSDKLNRALTAQELREEVFAQVWAFSNMGGGMDYLRDNLPTTHAFMEKAHAAVKATNYAATQGAQQGAQSGQVQAGQQGAQPVGAVSRASRQRKGLIDSNVRKLPKQLQQPVRNTVGTLSDLGGKYLDYAVFTSDLVKRAVAAGMPSAQKFADVLARRASRVSELEREIEKIADGYANIEQQFKGSARGSVNDFLFESTRTGKWGYGKYRDPKMGAAFDALGPKAQKFVKDVFAHGDKMLSDKKKVVIDAATSEYDAMIKAAQVANDTKSEAALKAEKAASLKRFQTLFRLREGMPYAPIKRNGTHVVIGKSKEYMAAVKANDTKRVKELESDPDHYHVSFADSKWEARSLKDRLEEQGAFDELNLVTRSEAFEEAFSGEALLPALTKMRAAVDKRVGADPTAGKMLSIINQLYLEALAEGSARKSEMRRRGIAGEVDMLQSFTQQGRADANFMANVQFEPLVQDQLQNMRNESRSGDRERKSELFNELTQRYADSLDVKVNTWVSGLTNLASKFFLASSPAYYLQNLTQPFMMSLPAMAGRHDYTKAASEMAKAYTELTPLFKDVKLFDQQFDFSKVPTDVRKAVNDLVNQGKIDIGLATEINEYKVDADGKLGQFAQRLNKGMRMAVQKTEAVNRLSTAIAAYRLEFAKTKDAAKATQYAADILTDTHGDYTAFNAPRAFNTQLGKVALQFRKFQLIQIAFYAKLIRDAFTNPAERAAAMKTLAYSLGHTAAFAGVMGLPGYAAIAFVLGAFGDDDEPYDLTADMRKAIGPEWADMIMRGAPTLAGVDLSGKIGSGNMLSIAPFSNADLSTTAGRYQAAGEVLLGAVGGMSTRMIDGLIRMGQGDYYKGVEQIMPKGVSDALKAGRLATEGMTRRNGDVILPESEISAMSAILTGLGVPSVKQAVTYERQNRMRDITENFQDRTKSIKNQYAKAVRQKDTASMQEAREAWTKLQQTRQRNGLKPQPVSDLLKAPQEQAQREQRTVGGVQYRKDQRKLAEDVVAN
jgi:hypothetical protein